MRLDHTPVYRKTIVSWYDSEIACIIFIVFMLIVLLFGFLGISVARETSEYRSFIWVPSLIVALSGGVIISTTIRLFSRFANLRNKPK
jgi:hypothetical protein